MNTWTDEEVFILKTLYPCNDNELIAEMLERTINSIQHKATRLGLKKPKEYIGEIQGNRFRGEMGPCWKGGKKKNRQGYILTLKRGCPGTDANGYIFEHRYVMEQHLGRKLTSEEVVHHVNGNKQDNRVENLQVLTKGEHERLHHIGRKRSDETKKKISEKTKKRFENSKPSTYKEVDINKLRQEVLSGKTVSEVCKENNISTVTYYKKLRKFKESV